MRTDRKLLIVACAARVVVAFAIFSLREDPITVPPPAPDSRVSNARPEPAGAPIEAAGSGAAAEADYFPLSDALHYLVEVSYKTDAPQFGIARRTVEGRETIRGKEYTKVWLRVSGIPEMREPVLRYCRKGSDAWHELDGLRKDNPAFEAVTLPLPPRVGVGWDKDTPDERSNWKVEGRETVVLGGTRYADCLRISYERRLKSEPDYFETGQYLVAPNVGLIQQVAMAAGTRIRFTLDQRSPEAIAFYTAWAGSYEGISARRRTGGLIQLSADGRYRMRRSMADSAVESGQYERNPTREGELILRGDSGDAVAYSFRRSEMGPGRGVLHLKCLEPRDFPEEEFLRDAPER